MNTLKRVNQNKVPTSRKAVKSTSAFRKFMLLLGVPILGIAGMIALSYFGILKFDHKMLIHRAIFVGLPIVIAIFVIFLLSKLSGNRKPKNRVFRFIINVFISILVVVFLVLVIPDEYLTDLQKFVETFIESACKFK